MAPRIKNVLHHSPDWYEMKLGENEGAPIVKAFFKADMGRIDGDWDEEITYGENVQNYREAWDKILTGATLAIGGESDGDSRLTREAVAVLESEMAKGFLPHSQYECVPWSTISELMDKYAVSVAHVREFLKWHARQGAVKKRKPRQKRKQKLTRAQQHIQGKFFKYSH